MFSFFRYQRSISNWLAITNSTAHPSKIKHHEVVLTRMGLLLTTVIGLNQE